MSNSILVLFSINVNNSLTKWKEKLIPPNRITHNIDRYYCSLHHPSQRDSPH